MQSPFPGMDPWLEGHLWPDVHQSLAYIIKKLLIPQVRPKYAVALNIYTIEDAAPDKDVGIMYPDVEVLKRSAFEEPPAPYGHFTPSTLTVPSYEKVEIKIPVVEIIDRKRNQLITAIEIISPVNKRKPGIIKYRQKREKLHEKGIHLLEIDLLRRGERPFNYPTFPPNAHYFVMLSRAENNNTEVWAMTVKDELPVVPIPLLLPDKDAKLDIGKALAEAYQDSDYRLLIDYSDPAPPPTFSAEELAWIKNQTHPKNPTQMRKYPAGN